MANTQVAPGKAELAEMLRRKLTQAQIVAEWQERTGQKCSRSAIAMAIKRYGLESARPRPRYEELIPWKVRRSTVTTGTFGCCAYWAHASEASP